jgi:hypothetical protein
MERFTVVDIKGRDRDGAPTGSGRLTLFRPQSRVRSSSCIGGSEKTIRTADLRETDYTPWEGHAVTARPSVTVPRGKVMMTGALLLGDLRGWPVPAA